MSLVLFSGGARSGKSAAAQSLALSTRLPVRVIVFGRADDPEMSERIAQHQADRPAGWLTVESHDQCALSDAIASGDCVLFDCLGTFVGHAMDAELADTGTSQGFDALCAPEGFESAIEARVESTLSALVARDAPTIVVSNEVGSGVVPATWSGRVFRDVLGRANRSLTESAQCAYLVACGRCVDLHAHPTTTELDWAGNVESI